MAEGFNGSWWRKEEEKIEVVEQVRSFDEMGLNENLLRGVYSYGLEYPSLIQQRAIVPLIKGRDMVAQAQSGTGKTVAFLLPALQVIDLSQKVVQVLILAPTRELATQIHTVSKGISDYLGTNQYQCIGGTSVRDDIKIIQSGVHLVIGLVGRTLDLVTRKTLDLSHVKLLIIDDADEMLSKNKIDETREIFQHLPSKVQVALFSATYPPEILEKAYSFLSDPIKILVKTNELTLEGIRHYHVKCGREEEKFQMIKDMYDSLNISMTIIFCNNKRKVDWLTEQLRQEDYTVSSFHGDIEQNTRNMVLLEFRNGSSRILITTDVLSRGIDIHGVSSIINYDIPRSEFVYYHRVGRAGRFGRRGVVFNICTQDDLETIRSFEEYFEIVIPEIRKEDLNQIHQYM